MRYFAWDGTVGDISKIVVNRVFSVILSLNSPNSLNWVYSDVSIK